LPANKTKLRNSYFAGDKTRRICHPASMPQTHVASFKPAFRLALLCFLAATITAMAGPVVTIRLEPPKPGAEVSPDFVGLSFEMQRVLADTNGNHFFSATNKNLIGTFKVLGIKNLRVGGNTADRPTLPVPTEADVDNLFAFAQAAEVKVIYTLRLNQGSLNGAVQMANYISQRHPNQLDCFAIGNEPNVFATNFDVYLADWKRFAAQITAPTNSPAAKFCGPSVSPGHEKWSARFAENLAASGRLKFIAQHDYPGGDARKATNAAVTRDRLLSPAMAEHYTQFAANFVPTIRASGLACRFEEANSLYDGGAVDASDTFAAALWALNYQWWWATHGISGINFHTGNTVAARDENKPCRYATFWTSTNGYNIHPIGYAEKMFSLGSRGKMIPANVLPATSTNLNFTAYAVRGDDNDFYITLINQSHGATATNLSVAISTPEVNGYTHGEIIRLTAPDGEVAAKTGVTLGGAEITDNAHWNGHWQSFPVPFKNHAAALTVELPAASAAVVKLTPR
jgi:hypothetical protein